MLKTITFIEKNWLNAKTTTIPCGSRTHGILAHVDKCRWLWRQDLTVLLVVNSVKFHLTVYMYDLYVRYGLLLQLLQSIYWCRHQRSICHLWTLWKRRQQWARYYLLAIYSKLIMVSEKFFLTFKIISVLFLSFRLSLSSCRIIQRQDMRICWIKFR